MLTGCSDDKILSHNSLTFNTKRINIMPLGDSITQGIHIDSKNTSYRRELYKLLKYNDFEIDFVGSMKNGSISDFDKDHEGHGGWHANQLQDSIYNWLIKNPADIILLHIGTNDLNKEESPTIIIQEIDQILSEVDRYEEKKNVPVKVVLATLINHLLYIEQTQELNNYITELVKNRQRNNDLIILADMNKYLEGTNYYLDNVHPNEPGYKKMADV
jgi:lysophospholipase L1-like esterase